MEKDTKTPKYATQETSSRIRLVDLDKEIRFEDVLGAIEGNSIEMVRNIMELIAHWTDDEGLHHIPFQDDLEKSLEEWMVNDVVTELREKGHL